MTLLLSLVLSGATVWATPGARPILARPRAVYWEEGRDPTVAVVKFRDGAGIYAQEGRLVGVDAALTRLLDGATLLPKARIAERHRHGAVDLATYARIQHPYAEVVATALLGDPRVESAWLAPLPVPPPADIPPTTPDMVAEMRWRTSDGFDFEEAWRWPGGRGENVQIADIEYAWDPDHEDLDGLVPPLVWGWDSGDYAFHGTMVLGMLSAGDNGYGMVGAVPDAAPMVLSPYDDDRWYDVAAAVLGAVELLGPGDVLLIEQQGFRHGTYCPVSAEPDVFDAIAVATAAGIVVVEPGGNGEADLDAPIWDGWFDREIQDSGAIMVGGGAPPDSRVPARTWLGSSYGSRVDIQGWYEGVATLANDEYGGYYADLFFPDEDGRQGYTSFFSGTSSASPMVAAAAVVLQSVAIALHGAPLSPAEVRGLLRSTGSPEPADNAPIGPQPDVRRLLQATFR